MKFMRNIELIHKSALKRSSVPYKEIHIKADIPTTVFFTEIEVNYEQCLPLAVIPNPDRHCRIYFHDGFTFLYK